MQNKVITFGTSQVDLGPAPIRSDWILEGSPVTRNKLLSGSTDGTSNTYIWDCTTGRFNWFYDIDETVYVLEGSVKVRDHHGITRTLVPGDTAYFPAGSSAEWTVDTYIRKMAFIQVPMPRPLRFAKRVLRSLKRMVRGNNGADVAPNMFPSN